MPKSYPAYRAVAAGLLALSLLGGCAPVKDWLRGSREPAEKTELVGMPQTDQYILEMYTLTSGDPATQAEIYADARAAATLTPDPSSRLRLALVLATPGHSATDPEEAQDLLRELLAQTELLTSAEVSLATIQLRDIEERLKLLQQSRHLQRETSRAASSEQRAIEQRIALVEAQNRQLKQSLAEAEQKLEAITTIERSMREQAENGETPP